MLQETVKAMQTKLDEAEHFLNEMKKSEYILEKITFTHNFSAFSTSIRSVLQYALEYDQNVYKQLIPNLKYSKLFTRIRNENIHEKPIATLNAGSSSITVTVTVVNPNDESANSLEEDVEQHENVMEEYYFVSEEQFPDYPTVSLVMLSEEHTNDVRQFIKDFSSHAN